MEKTYIIGNNESLLQLGEKYAQLPQNVNEVEIHNWVVELFRNNEIEKIIIEIKDNPILSLQIGYHIRLSIEELKECSLIPIMYISGISLNSILLQSGVYSQLLSTKGVYYSDYDLPSNKEEVNHINGLKASEYLVHFLKLINIQPAETIGRHSLANIWGAHVMDKAANSNALSQDSDFKKELYFKYVSAFNILHKLKPSLTKVVGNINIGTTNRINAEGKRVLLIDDEAKKGWETVFRKILKTTSPDDFVVIDEKVKDYDSFSAKSKKIIEEQDFDLYLVDLRLNGLDEDEIQKTEKFSGMKILRKIKNLNKGNQVIVFTASNKVWNLKALLDEGADNYYMKESPEYNFSSNLSEQNYIEFKENIKKCFDRNFLKKIYSEWENAKSNNTNIIKDFIYESETALDMAWEQISNGYLDFGFLTLFQSIESIANKLYKYDEQEDRVEDVVTINKSSDEKHEWLMTYKKDYQNGSYFISEKNNNARSLQPTTLFKVSCMFKIIYDKDDIFLKRIGSLNDKRNNIAHKGPKGFATGHDLVELLMILGEIRTN